MKPMIPVDVLIKYGAEVKEITKDDFIFKEGQYARCYYQLISGEIKMNNFNDQGKEFIQGIFSEGDSFGEPPLFIEVKYPAGAQALTDVELLKLPKEAFLSLLKENPELHLDFTTRLAARLYYKAIMANELSSQEPEHRILRFLDYLKKFVYKLDTPFSFKIDLTRQQIADLTGLRVETVIRAAKSLEQKGELKIIDRKLYR